jgi:hypothetical protein
MGQNSLFSNNNKNSQARILLELSVSGLSGESKTEHYLSLVERFGILLTNLQHGDVTMESLKLLDGPV